VPPVAAGERHRPGAARNARGLDEPRAPGKVKGESRQPLPAIFAPVENKARIVIAEDEAIIRLDLREMLQEEGYEVVGEASSGETALNLVQELHPDLAILDIVMPGMDGLTAAAKINEGQLAAVLILTAFSQRDLVAKATESGAMAYLVKPFDRNDLVPMVELAIARWAEARALAAESKNLSERLESRKLVERAKGVLMETQGLSEQESFRLIQKLAMQRRASMRDVADQVLRNQ
jgi:AmiR/NasT family two-component response regulator